MRRIAPDSDRARGWDGVAAQSSARRGMGLGLRRMGLTVESSPGEGWDGVAAHHRRGAGWDGVDCLPGEGWGWVAAHSAG